jgi:c-di-GMP-binding flagellar brake protein YcgR
MDQFRITDLESQPTLEQVRTGSGLMVEMEGEYGQHRCTLLGMVPREYMVITLPEISGAIWLLNPGFSLVVRLLDRGVVYGFRTQVLGKYVMDPVRLAFLAWPEEVETHQLRRQERLQSYFPARMTTENGAWSGVVTDLSPGGFQFQGRAEGVPLPEPPGNGQEVILDCRLVGMSGTHTVQCEVRNLRQEGAGVAAGLSFSQNEGALPRVIAAYVQEVLQLLREISSSTESKQDELG